MKCNFFDLEELVSEQVYNKYGQMSWQFFDPRILITIDWIREKLNRAVTINNWVWGGNLDERGLRENTSPIVYDRTMNDVIYLSGHVLGMAIDFDVEGMSADEVRKWLILNQKELPYPIRIEAGVSWNHIDVMNISGNKIYIFKA
jgi:hypothetical protein